MSVQIGINLELLLTDPQEYEKQKKEKIQNLGLSEPISIDKIEKAVLDLFQNKNATLSDTDKQVATDPASLLQNPKDLQAEALLKQNDLAQQVPKPQDPLADVMKEINDIKSQTYGSNGR